MTSGASSVADVMGIDYLCGVNDVNVVYLVLKACVVRYCGRLFYRNPAKVLRMFYIGEDLHQKTASIKACNALSVSDICQFSLVGRASHS